MVLKKKIVVAIVTAVALSVGVAGTASAHGNGAKSTAERAASDAQRVADKAAHEAERAAFEALVAKTIGVDVAVIKTRLAAGETLGAIAGTKKAALIDVIVADKTKHIDAAVTAGKLTAAQATTMKAGLVAHVTAEVDSVRGPKGGPGMDDHKGHKGGKDGHGAKGGHAPKGGMTPPPAGTTSGNTSSYKA
ncbi:MAG: hypothetical protein NTV90_04035 [Actinobacteria bacterium]|nr:hypothetical protein [Actinomycetota bacterium]